VDYRFGVLPSQPAVADFNGDGGVDMAVTNEVSKTVSVLLNLPVISVYPNAVNFGTEKVGNTSNPQVVTIGNPSGTPITLHTLKMNGPDKGDFAQTNNCPLSPTTLAPGDTCTVNVTFTPQAKGKRRAQITVEDSVAGSPQAIRLNGEGT
jgi:hypothetical protein